MTTVEDPTMLTEGYAVATATFNTFQVQCNDVLSAETVMMVKERFIEEFGVPVHTIGEGAREARSSSTSSCRTIRACSTPRSPSCRSPTRSRSPRESPTVACSTIYATRAGSAFTPEQRAAINGHAVAATCDFWDNSFLVRHQPDRRMRPGHPEVTDLRPGATKRNGIRCTLQDGNVNQFGRDPKTGFARRPLDNVGVQYGLKALNTKKISVDQFLARQPGSRRLRHRRSPPATTRGGRSDRAAGLLRGWPGIDGCRRSTQGPDHRRQHLHGPAGDIHDRFRAFSLRDRLTGGDTKDAKDALAPNFQIWTRGTPGTTLNEAIGNITTGGGLGPEVVDVLNGWLDRLDRDRSGASRENQLAKSRPAEAVDNCIDATGKRISGVGIYQRPGPCTTPYPLHDDPRTAAGAPAFERHPQVPAQADRPEGLQGAVHRGAAGQAAPHLPGWGLRLGAGRCRPGQSRTDQPDL